VVAPIRYSATVTWGDEGTAITATGSCAGATLAFRVGGQLRVTAVVKATFALAPDRPMVLVDPDPIVRTDEHRRPDPSSSLAAASDLVPYRPRTDVLLQGHAHAPLARPARSMMVRLMMARGRSVVLDKRLAVRGPLELSGQAREPSPFSTMLLAWELSVGTPDNPAGISEGPRRWPHILDPWRHDRAAGFGPVSPRWPSRRHLLGMNDSALDAPIPELPGGFAWAYFNAAPEDQRLDFLHGDEWIVLEGMHSQILRMQSCLPRVRASARVVGPPLLDAQPIPLEADTLLIDTDRQRCSIVWRGSFPVAREADLATLRVFAGVETAECPLALPTSYPELPPLAAAAARRLPTGVHPASQALPASSQPTADERFPPLQMPAHVTTMPQRATPFELDSSEPHTIALDVSMLRRRLLAMSVVPASRPLPAMTPSEPLRATRAGVAPEPLPEQLASEGPRTVALDVSLLRSRAPATPFSPAAAPPCDAPSQPLPAATPFEQAVLTPAPSPIEPMTLAFAVVPPVPAVVPSSRGPWPTMGTPELPELPGSLLISAPEPPSEQPAPEGQRHREA
jgi:hypothetical protein